jgi:hypothetical protein
MKKYFFKTIQLLNIFKKFIIREYKWIIVIIITIPTSIVAYQNIKFGKQSDSFYYIPPYFERNDINNLDETDCWIGSISTNRSDAFRCSYKNDISDPCFQDPVDSSLVACPSSPSDKNPPMYKAKINSKYRNNLEKNPEFNSPWYIIMHDGSKCRMITGASIIVADKRYDYQCMDGEIGSLLLPIKQKDEKMYISCTGDNRIIRNCLIKEAWY